MANIIYTKTRLRPSLVPSLFNQCIIIIHCQCNTVDSSQRIMGTWVTLHIQFLKYKAYMFLQMFVSVGRAILSYIVLFSYFLSSMYPSLNHIYHRLNDLFF